MIRKGTNLFDQISTTIQRNQTVLLLQTFFKQNPQFQTKINSIFFHFRSSSKKQPYGIVLLDEISISLKK